jgi:hypothetical protein
MLSASARFDIGAIHWSSIIHSIIAFHDHRLVSSPGSQILVSFLHGMCRMVYECIAVVTFLARPCMSLEGARGAALRTVEQEEFKLIAAASGVACRTIVHASRTNTFEISKVRQFASRQS